MGDQATNALVAIVLGTVLAVVLLIPTAAVQYRLDGRLGPLDLTILFTSAVYSLAIWTYTLLPMPVDGTFACKGSQLRVLGSFGLIHVPDSGGPLALLREPAFQQIVLNVLLFVPLGYFLRVILHRGIVVATLSGFALSLLIELTQKTGVWHLYSCAYRLFDVDDLIVNTLGAMVGSLLSILVVRRRDPDVVLPTTISYGRRLVGFACDVLFIALTGAAAALAWRGWEIYVRDVPAGDVSGTCRPPSSGASRSRWRRCWCWASAGPWASGWSPCTPSRGGARCCCPAGWSSWRSASGRCSCSRRCGTRSWVRSRSPSWRRTAC